MPPIVVAITVIVVVAASVIVWAALRAASQPDPVDPFTQVLRDAGEELPDVAVVPREPAAARRIRRVS